MLNACRCSCILIPTWVTLLMLGVVVFTLVKCFFLHDKEGTLDEAIRTIKEDNERELTAYRQELNQKMNAL